MLVRRFTPSSMAIYPSKNAPYSNTPLRSSSCRLDSIIVESIPPKILPIRSHFRRKLHLLDFSRRKARDKSGVASQSTSWLHQLVDTPRHKRICSSLCSFKCGGWAARPATCSYVSYMLARRFTPSIMAIYPSKNAPYSVAFSEKAPPFRFLTSQSSWQIGCRFSHVP